MKIWILQSGEPVHTDSEKRRPMRAMSLADALISDGHEVTLWTSDFDHFTKSHRFGFANTVEISNYLTINFVPSCGYAKHVGLMRLFDHIHFAYNLRKKINSQISPDVALIGFPPIESAWVFSKWLKSREVPFLVDVKDMWPEIILDEFPFWTHKLLKIPMRPLFKMRDYVFNSATGISSITQEFLNWSLEHRNFRGIKSDLVAPLTSPEYSLSESDLKAAELFWDEKGVKDDGAMRAFFAGTQNGVYDFEPILQASKELNVQFVLAGNGPQYNWLVESSKNLTNVFLPGWISEAQLEILARRSQIALAPIKERKDFQSSIPNKFIDALRLGKPMITSNTGVSERLLLDHKAGKIYKHGDTSGLINCLQELLLDPNLLKTYSENAKELYLKQFSHEKNYSALVHRLISIVK
jgi:glycosyltransferase involved in cell wall biosynthesis